MAKILTQQYSAITTDSLPGQELAVDMARAIKASTTVGPWCKVHYGRAPKIVAGTDPEDLLKEDSYPLVDLWPVDFGDVGYGAEEHSCTIIMTSGLYDSSKEPLVYNGLDFLRGLKRSGDFCMMLLEAVSGIDLQGGYIKGARPRLVEEIMFPFFLTETEIQIVKPL